MRYHQGRAQNPPTAIRSTCCAAASSARGDWGRQPEECAGAGGPITASPISDRFSVNADDRLRPDVMIGLPGRRRLVIDAEIFRSTPISDAKAAGEVEDAAPRVKARRTSIPIPHPAAGREKLWRRCGGAAIWWLCTLRASISSSTSRWRMTMPILSWALRRRAAGQPDESDQPGAQGCGGGLDWYVLLGIAPLLDRQCCPVDGGLCQF